MPWSPHEDRLTLDRTILMVSLMMAIALTLNVEHSEPLWLGKIGVALLWLGVGFGVREEIASIDLTGEDYPSILDGDEIDQS